MPDPAVLDRSRELDVSPVEAAQADRRAPSAVIELAVFDSLDEAELLWRALEAGADCTPFQTFDWLSTWYRHVGLRMRARPAIVVGRRENGEPLFLFPFAIMPGFAKRLTWLGCDLSDYNAPLLAPEFSELVPPDRFMGLWREVCSLLQGRPQHRHDLVELLKMPERQGPQDNPFLALPTALNPSHAYVADLGASWDAFYHEKRSSATRRRDRTKLKRLGEIGEVRFVTPRDRFEIECTMETLVEQKAKSFTRMGVANIFARPGWHDFYFEIATGSRMQNMSHVSRLDVGPYWSAINLGLTFRGSYYHVLASYDEGETARFGPGAAHLRELLRYAIERGLCRFDFTIGDERYKLEWSDRTLRLHDHVAAAGLRGWPVAAALHGKRRLKRLIKQNDHLWSLVSKARAAFGAKSGNAPDAAATTSGKPPTGKSPPIAPE